MIPQVFIQVGQVFASLRLTIFILLSLALAMSLGTIYEAEQGTAAARVTFYRAWWFDFLLVLLTLNLLGCTYLRRPKRTARWAYLLMHNSILLIFAGGLIGRWFGVEGQLVFAEGQSKQVILSEENILRVRFASGDSYEFSAAPVDAFPQHRHPETVFALDRHGIDLQARTFFPDYDEEPGALPGDPDRPGAIHLEFTRGREKARHWLYTKGPDSGLSVGGMPVSVHDGRPEPDPADLPPVGGMLELSGVEPAFRVFVPTTGAQGATTAIEGTPYSVTVQRTFSRFSMQEKAPVDLAEGPENPAVLFRISSKEGGEDQTRIAFSKFPDFDDEHGRNESRIRVRYHFHPRALQIFYDRPSNQLTGRLVEPTQLTDGPLLAGSRYPVPGSGDLSVKVIEALPHARPAMVPVNRSNKVSRPAIELSIENLAGSATTWLVFEEPKQVAFGDSVATLEYTRREIPLGFELELQKFHVGRYQGTNNPSSFESTVTLKDPEAGLDEQRVISMNRPLVHKGFTCYQSSYIEGPRMVSVLSVAHDPGGTIAYVGFTSFMIGFICVITFRQNRKRKSS